MEHPLEKALAETGGPKWGARQEAASYAWWESGRSEPVGP